MAQLNMESGWRVVGSGDVQVTVSLSLCVFRDIERVCRLCGLYLLFVVFMSHRLWYSCHPVRPISSLGVGTEVPYLAYHPCPLEVVLRAW